MRHLLLETFVVIPISLKSHGRRFSSSLVRFSSSLVLQTYCEQLLSDLERFFEYVDVSMAKTDAETSSLIHETAKFRCFTNDRCYQI